MTGRLFDEAAQWFVILASGEASDVQRRRWREWCAASPAHAAAWQRAAACAECFAQWPGEPAAALRALGRVRRADDAFSPGPGVGHRARLGERRK